MATPLATVGPQAQDRRSRWGSQVKLPVVKRAKEEVGVFRGCSMGMGGAKRGRGRSWDPSTGDSAKEQQLGVQVIRWARHTWIAHPR